MIGDSPKIRRYTAGPQGAIGRELSSAPARGIDPCDQLVDDGAGRKRHEAEWRAKADLGSKGARVSQRQGDTRGIHELRAAEVSGLRATSGSFLAGIVRSG